MKIRDCIKDKQTFADRVGVTRPWLYKLMDRYDEGNHSGIPEKVLREFKNAEKRYYDDSNIPLDIDLSERAEDLLAKIDEIKKSIHLKEKEWDRLEKEGESSDNDDKFNNWISQNQLNEEINELDIQANDLAREYDSVMKEKAKLSNTPYITHRTIGTGTTDTYPFFDGKKYMITWDSDIIPNQLCELNLFIKLKGRYHRLKSYYPKKGENFIIIDDVVFDAPLFYTIYHEYEMMYDEDMSSTVGEALCGMTRLKPVVNEE